MKYKDTKLVERIIRFVTDKSPKVREEATFLSVKMKNKHGKVIVISVPCDNFAPIVALDLVELEDSELVTLESSAQLNKKLTKIIIDLYASQQQGKEDEVKEFLKKF